MRVRHGSPRSGSGRHARMHETRDAQATTLGGMAAEKSGDAAAADESWPHERFIDYLDELMASAGIASDTRLDEKSGVSQSLISRWRNAKLRPSMDNLRKIASAVGVPAVRLWVAAGHVQESDLELAEDIDFSVLPPEIRKLAVLLGDPGLSPEADAAIRAMVAAANAFAESARTGQRTGQRTG